MVAAAAAASSAASSTRRTTERVASTAERRSSSTAHRDQLEAYEALAHELGHAPGELALAWLLHQPGVTGPITGPRTMDQLDSAVAAVDITLDEDALARLDEIFPGHKTAPEDYAW